MSAYVIFDVEIRDPARYQEFMAGVKPALEARVPDTWPVAVPTRSTKATGSRAGLCFWSSRRSRRGRNSILARSTRG